MMLAMFAGKNRDHWDYLLPAVMMAYRSSVHESTGFSPYRLMFGEECTLPMDIGLPKEQSNTPNTITSPYAIWVRDALEEAYDQVRQHSREAVQRQKRLDDRRAVKRQFSVGDWAMRFYTTSQEFLIRLTMYWTLSSSVIDWLGNRNTKGPRIPNSDSILPGYQKDTASAGSRVLAEYKESIEYAIGYDPGCQPLCNGHCQVHFR